jgi:hypothetical protein
LRILLGRYLRLLNWICRQFLSSRCSILSHGWQLYVIFVDKLGLHPIYLLSLLCSILQAPIYPDIRLGVEVGTSRATTAPK